MAPPSTCEAPPDLFGLCQAPVGGQEPEFDQPCLLLPVLVLVLPRHWPTLTFKVQIGPEEAYVRVDQLSRHIQGVDGVDVDPRKVGEPDEGGGGRSWLAFTQVPQEGHHRQGPAGVGPLGRLPVGA